MQMTIPLGCGRLISPTRCMQQSRWMGSDQTFRDCSIGFVRFVGRMPQHQLLTAPTADRLLQFNTDQFCVGE